MEKFKKVYPFTTENIAGYMHNLDLTGKKVITVTGSGDHALNAILRGSTDITCFDVNPHSKDYSRDKIDAILSLSYEDFIRYLLLDNQLKSKYDLEFKYYNPDSKKRCNLYLSREEFYRLKSLLASVSIRFIDANITDLKIKDHFDYMFLSNISDYLSLLYQSEELERYQKLLMQFLEYIDYIYFAYLYDVEDDEKRSRIDQPSEVDKVFKSYKKIEFPTALEGKKTKDAVLMLKRSDYFGK